MLLSEKDLEALNAGQHAAPFEILGPQPNGKAWTVTTIQPDAVAVAVVINGKETLLDRVSGDVFSGEVADKAYTLKVTYADDQVVECSDAYAFGPMLTDFDQYLMGEGTHYQLWRAVGAHVTTHEDVAGTHFAVWAPNATRVSVVGDFNM